jgi:(2Fe-2S) ferredoxin
MADEIKAPRRKRLVLCMGPHCNHNRQAEPLYERLRQELGDPRPAFMARTPVTWEIANCLNMCDEGPNLVVYPEKIIYHALDLDTLEAIIAHHVRADSPHSP